MSEWRALLRWSGKSLASRGLGPRLMVGGSQIIDFDLDERTSFVLSTPTASLRSCPPTSPVTTCTVAFRGIAVDIMFRRRYSCLLPSVLILKSLIHLL